MRLFESILDVNPRRVAGDLNARVSSAEHASSLPIAALSCIDVRLNHLLPDMLGVAEEQFIWLRNAGNIITSPLSSTMRSLALACAVKGGKEIAVIGHTDCQVCKTTMLQLLDRLGALGVDRHRLPENLVEYFGLFSSERQNVIRAVELVRSSPLIGIKIPVHGLLIDIKTGRLEWVVNGYTASDSVAVPGKVGELLAKAENQLNQLERIGNQTAEEFKLPHAKIGEIVSTARDWVHRAEHAAAAIAPVGSAKPSPPPVPASSATPPAVQADPLKTLQQRAAQFTALQRQSPRSRKP